MPIAVESTVQAIAAIVQTVPVGTNLALMHLLWAMVNGSFLHSRGAVFGALWANGFSVSEVRRSGAALRTGAWQVNELLDNWQVYVASENRWRMRRHEGYQVVSVDLTGFWRPHLQGWVGKHYHSLAQKALPAVVFGVMVLSGEVVGRPGTLRVPLLRRVIRCQPTLSKAAFRGQLLQEAATEVTAKQVVVVDAEFGIAEFGIAELQAAGVTHYVVRMASNATAQRNALLPYKGRGRPPKYGETVRPVARTWRARRIEATAADQQSRFEQEGRTIQVCIWHNLVLPHTPPSADAATFSLYLFHDPLYKQPLLLATNLSPLKPETIFHIYRDRWTAEQPPLAAKQMVGLHRQFVFAPASCFRLPELSLVAGSLLTYMAAVLPPVPSGFWDRTPQPTPGRLRRLLAHSNFQSLAVETLQLRKKNSLTAHLPKGIDAHRRLKHAA
jgi:DDE superfamily endonuclease